MDKKFANKITIDKPAKKIWIDDQEFPWHLTAEDGIQIDGALSHAFATVTFKVFAGEVVLIEKTGKRRNEPEIIAAIAEYEGRDNA